MTEHEKELLAVIIRGTLGPKPPKVVVDEIRRVDPSDPLRQAFGISVRVGKKETTIARWIDT